MGDLSFETAADSFALAPRASKASHSLRFPWWMEWASKLIPWASAVSGLAPFSSKSNEIFSS